MSGFALSLVGSFCGASFAFTLEAIRRYRAERSKQYEAILATQATLISHFNSLLSIHKEISDQTNQKNPFDNLKTMLLTFPKRAIDFRDLAFLGKSTSPQLLMALDVAQSSFEHCVAVIELRNRLIREFFDDPSTTVTDFDPDSDHIVATGNLPKITAIKKANVLSLSSVEHAKKENLKASGRLFAFGKAAFPKKRLLYGTVHKDHREHLPQEVE